MKHNPHMIFAFSVTSLLIGCAGYDRTFLATKTNVGLDIDTRPPTAEITIARRELAIQPSYPDVIAKSRSSPGKDGDETKETSLPLLASFGLQGPILDPRITANFAGGDAALALAEKPSEAEHIDSSICLGSLPDTRSPFLKFWHWLAGKTLEDHYKDKRSRPFYFATDTSYGLKVAWSGSAGPYPDTLKLGYNRKEFAYPPLFVDKIVDKDTCGTGGLYNVKLPSFYASIDNGSGWTPLAGATANDQIWNGHIKHVQFFATGKAATEFAKRASVRQIAFQNMAPDAAQIEGIFPLIPKLNQATLADIKVAYAKADSAKQQAILGKAKALELVDDKTDAKGLPDALGAKASSAEPQIANNLISLRQFAQTN